VFRNGRIVAELKGASLTHEQLVHAASLAGDPHREGVRVH